MFDIKRFLPKRDNLSYQYNSFKQETVSFKNTVIFEPYKKPQKNDVLLIIPFFNPCCSARLVQNLLFVKSKFDVVKVPYTIIHCLFPESCPILPKSNNYITVRTKSFLFLKENLANIAICKNKLKYSKFVILDGDIIFGNKNWYDSISVALDKFDIIQPYSVYRNLDSNFCNILFEGQATFHKTSYNIQHNIETTSDTRGHPGYAIAFTLKYYEKIGYPDETVIGGGDTLTCSIALKEPLFRGHNNSKHFDYLYTKHSKDISISWGCIDGIIYHLYHNISINRQYSTRYSILDRYVNDDTSYKTIDDIIVKNKEGVYEWIDDIREDINKDMLNYFATRQDDEIA